MRGRSPPGRPGVPWGPRYIILEVLAPPLGFFTFFGFSSNLEVVYGSRRLIQLPKCPLVGSLPRRGQIWPPDFGETRKKVENLKGGANTSRMVYRGPQGTSGRAEGRGGRCPPITVVFCPFSNVTTIEARILGPLLVPK